MFSLFKKSEEEIAVIFDIGSGSIGVSLVQFSMHNVPVTLYTHRAPLTFLPSVESKRLLDSMLALLKTVSQHLHKEGLVQIHHSFFGQYVIKDVFCVFSSPWYTSKTKVLKTEKDKPFLVTKGYIDELILTEEKAFREAIKSNEEASAFGTDTRFLEKKIIHTKLNGYEIQNPIGKKAKELELTLFSSFISTDILKRIESMLHGTLHFRNIQFYSYALASWSAVQSMFPDTSKFLFLDVSGEMTDISLTNKGVLTETISFQSGRNILLRKVAETLKVPPEVALSYLIMHSQGVAEKKFAAKIEAVVKETMKEWHAELIETLRALSKTYSMPSKLFITVDGDVSKFFMDALKEPVPMEFSVMNNVFDVTYLNADKVNLFNHFAPKVIPDPFLGLESIFLHKVISIN